MESRVTLGHPGQEAARGMPLEKQARGRTCTWGPPSLPRLGVAGLGPNARPSSGPGICRRFQMFKCQPPAPPTPLNFLAPAKFCAPHSQGHLACAGREGLGRPHTAGWGLWCRVPAQPGDRAPGTAKCGGLPSSPPGPRVRLCQWPASASEAHPSGGSDPLLGAWPQPQFGAYQGSVGPRIS